MKFTAAYACIAVAVAHASALTGQDRFPVLGKDSSRGAQKLPEEKQQAAEDAAIVASRILERDDAAASARGAANALRRVLQRAGNPYFAAFPPPPFCVERR